MSRVLGIDYGRKRIGLAISDPTRTLASPLAIWQRTRRKEEAARFQALVRDERVSQVVVGLPVHSSGRESELAAEARAFGSWLAEITGCPVAFRDERYTSLEANEILRGQGIRASQRRAYLDKLAAQLILQAYLDAGCPIAEAPPAALEDEPRSVPLG